VRGFGSIVRRDLRVAFRRPGEILNPVVFFVVAASLFPLAMTPELSQLRDIGIAVLWVSALLSSLLTLDGLFRSDAEDGSLEQLVLSPIHLGTLVTAKITAHWLTAALPLLLVAPLVAYSFYLPQPAVVTGVLALLLATPTLSILGAIGASLTVSLHRGGGLLGLLVLPLATPVLIFGARAMDLSMAGESPAGPLWFLAALLTLAVSLGPLAVGGALRVSLE
jgi:heme exporter protein B